MKTIARLFIPNLGTLILVGLLLLLANNAGASPLGAPLTAPPSAVLISYQGELTDNNGTPINGTRSMTFKLYHQATGGTAVWTETQNVSVSDGLFHVLLGSVTALNSSILTGDLYLGVKVGTDSEMTPRERLGSVPYAVEASTVPDGSITTAKLNLVSGNVGIGTASPGAKLEVSTSGNPISKFYSSDSANKWVEIGNSATHMNLGVSSSSSTTPNFPYIWSQSDKFMIGSDGNPTLAVVGMNNGNVGVGTTSPIAKLHLGGGSFGIQMGDNGTASQNFHITIDDWVGGRGLRFWNGNYGSGSHIATFLANGNVGIGTPSPGAKLDVSGDLNLSGNVQMNASNISNVTNIYGAGGAQIHMPPGLSDVYINWHQGGNLVYGGGQGTTKFMVDTNGNVTCGGLVEANLQTPGERDGKSASRFELGDVLVWGDGQLEKCSQANDPLVQAVADKDGKPIVMGAEVIKVIGPVQKGDYLVTSDVPGYAMAARNPTFGVVIAQALESFDGEKGIIKAMIRKM